MCLFRLYFANSGLRTRLNLLNTFRSWWTLAILIILASIAKIVPVSIATKIFTRKSWFYCTSMGVLMNTRGIVQLVVLNIGVQLKVISPVIFAMFVLMATVLTFLTSPILSILYSKVKENSSNEIERDSDQENPVEDRYEKSLGKLSIISVHHHSTRKVSSNPSEFKSNQSNEHSSSFTSKEKQIRRMTLF